ncbi:MAG: tyrosine-type recombinase/integrase, partial [Chloroflexi bacterium]|nr:tyrosine-type recombinase/integrase [Chloroflexota bacterium]
PRPVDRATLGAGFRSAQRIVQLSPGEKPSTLREIPALQITGLIVRLLTVTGLRIGELTSLHVCDVTGTATQIRVRGKGDRERIVYVANDRLQTDFRRFWEIRCDMAGSQAWLFTNAKGDRLTSQAFRKRLRTLSKSLRIEPHLTPHQFRHSAATMLIEEGVDIRLVQRLLGHASIATTEIYTKVSDNSLSSAVATADTLAKVDTH